MRAFLLAICFCLSMGAGAQGIDGIDPLSKLFPARGSYFDRSKPGTGLQVDVDNNGALFAVFNTFTSSGAPAWYVISGTYLPASDDQRLAIGLIGILTAPLLQVAGGQCITCDFTAMPSVTSSPNIATLNWATSRHVDLMIGNEAWHMDAAEYTIADGDLLAGTWLMAISSNAAGDLTPGIHQLPGRTAIVTLRAARINNPVPFLPRFFALAGSDPSIRLPSPGSVIYTFDCGFGYDAYVPCPASSLWTDVFSLLGLDMAATAPATPIVGGHPNAFRGGPFIWYDPVTRRAAMDVVSTRTPGIDTEAENIGPSNLHFDLVFDADRVVGHGITQGPNPDTTFGPHPGLSFPWLSGRVAFNLVMTRLPSGVRENCIVNCPSR